MQEDELNWVYEKNLSKELQHSLDTAEVEIDSLKSRVKKEEEESFMREQALIHGYKAEINGYAEQISELKQKQTDSTSSDSEQQDLLRTYKTKVALNERTNLEVARQLKQLQKELDDNSSATKDMEQALAIAKMTSTDLEKRYDIQFSGHKREKLRADELENRLKECADKAADNWIEHTEHVREIEELKTQYTEISSELALSKKAPDDLKRELERKDRIVAEKNRVIIELEEAARQRTVKGGEEIQDQSYLRNHNEDIEFQLEEANCEVSNTREQLSKMDESVMGLKRELSSKESDIGALKEKEKEMCLNLEKIREEILQLNNKLAQETELKTEIIKTMESKLQESLSNYNDNKAQTEAKISSLKDEIMKLKDLDGSSDRKIKQLESELESQKNDKIQFEGEIRTLSAELIKNEEFSALQLELEEIKKSSDDKIHFLENRLEMNTNETIQELNDKIIYLEAQIVSQKELAAEIEDCMLGRQKEAEEVHIRRLRDHIQTAEKEMSAMKANADAIIHDLEEELKAMQTKVVNQEETISTGSAEWQKNQKKLEDAAMASKSKLVNVMSELAIKGGQLVDLGDRNEELSEQAEIREQLITSQKEQLDKFQQTVENLKTSFDDKLRHCETEAEMKENRTVLKLDDKFKELQKELTLQSDIAADKGAILQKNMDDKISNLEDDVKIRTEQINELNKLLSELRTNSDCKDKELSELNTCKIEIAEIRSSLHMEKTLLARSKETCKEMDIKVNHLTEELSATKERLTADSESMSTAQANLEECKKDLVAQQNENSNLERKLNEFQMESDALQHKELEKFDDISTELSEAKSVAAKQAEKLARLEVEVRAQEARFTTEMETFQNLIEECQKQHELEVSVLKQDNDKLEDQLKENRAQKKECEEQTIAMKEEFLWTEKCEQSAVRKYQSKIEDLENSKSSESERNDNLQKSLDTSESKCKEIQLTVSKLKEEMYLCKLQEKESKAENDKLVKKLSVLEEKRPVSGDEDMRIKHISGSSESESEGGGMMRKLRRDKIAAENAKFEAECELSNTKWEIESLKQKVKQLENQSEFGLDSQKCSESKQRSFHVQSKVDDARVIALQEQVGDLERTVSEKNGNNRILVKEMSNCQETMEKLDARLETLQSELSEKEQTIMELRTSAKNQIQGASESLENVSKDLIYCINCS